MVAYAALGKGMLTGRYKTLDDIPKDSVLRHWPRFQPDTFPINIELVKNIQVVAERKGVTPAQLAISWVSSVPTQHKNLTILPLPGATTAARVIENSKHVDITAEEFAEIDSILKKFEVVGARYPPFITTDT